MHEYLYLIARNEGKQDSRSTRQLLKLLISNNTGSKLDKIVRLAFNSGFLKNKPLHHSNGNISGNGLDYTLHAGPINAIYYISTGYLHNLAHVVKTFDEKKPSYIENSQNLIEQSRKLFNALGIKLKTRAVNSLSSVSKSLQVIKENQEVINQSTFAEMGNKLKKNLQLYIEERRSSIIREMSRLKPIFREHYLNNLRSYLTEAQLNAIEEISKNVGENYLRLIENPIISNGQSSSRHDDAGGFTSQEKIFYSVENLAERSFPTLMWDLNNYSSMKKNLSWVTTEIYKSYHKNGTLNYLDFIFPTL